MWYVSEKINEILIKIQSINAVLDILRMDDPEGHLHQVRLDLGHLQHSLVRASMNLAEEQGHARAEKEQTGEVQDDEKVPF